MLACLLCSVLDVFIVRGNARVFIVQCARNRRFAKLKTSNLSHEAKNKLVEIGTQEKKAEVFSDSADVLLSRERPTELGNSSIVCLVMYSSLYL